MTIYEFSWKPFNRPKGDKHYVQTHDKKMMDLFLTQHGFDPNSAGVIVTDDPQYSDDDTITLHMYTFGSQKQDRLYHIATTQELMTVVIAEVTAELMPLMSFGSCALKGEIQLFDRIDKLMSHLDYAYIRETSQHNSPEDYDNGYYHTVYPNYPIDPTYEELSRDDEQDALGEFLEIDAKPSDTDPVAITIEAYVSYFTQECLLGKVEKIYGKKGIANQ